MISSTEILIRFNMNKRSKIKSFNQRLQRIDKYLYCSFDYKSGFYKVYKKLPLKLWGQLGDFDGEGFYLFTIETKDNQPRLPSVQDLIWIRRMAMKAVPYSARTSKWWTKYQF